jgi:hypothetical protein
MRTDGPMRARGEEGVCMRETTRDVRKIAGTAIGLAFGALASTLACAQSSIETTPNAWKFSGTLYGYLPSLGGRSTAPADSGGTPINVTVSEIIDALKFTVMGSFDAHNGRWGMFTDVLYLDLGANKQQSSNFTIGSIGLPVGTTADLGLDLKGLIWTAAGEYRFVADPGLTLDGVAGARWLDLRQTLRWNISGNLGPIDPAGRSGVHEGTVSVVDAIVGVKGRAALGSEQRWFVPFYADIGTGQSDLTWQAAAGISYAYRWGEISALWRYLGYDMKPGESVVKLNFSGPMVGATFRW